MNLDVRIRLANASDRPQLESLRHALWPDSSPQENSGELDLILDDKSSMQSRSLAFVAQNDRGIIVGFLEASLRSHADGCDTSRPVGFIEGWYVDESHRRKGIGRRLLAAAEEWARTNGCLEMASDALICNETSQRAHEALGYTEVDRCVHYRKLL